MRVAHAAQIILAGLAALLALGAGDPLDAQWSFDVRGVVSSPVGDFASVEGLEAEPGAGLGADLIYNEDGAVSAYAGGSATWFGCEGCAEAEGYRSAGFEGGVKLLINAWVGPLPWVRGGIVLHRLRIDRGAVAVLSDWSPGYQIVAGIDVPLAGGLYVTPSLRYEAYEARFADALDDTDVRHLSLEMAAHIHFGELRE